MIEIRPHALYSRSDLIELLKPLGIDADSFIARIRPKKVFRNAWFGRDILSGLADAPALENGNGDTRPTLSLKNNSRKPGSNAIGSRRAKTLEANLDPLKALMRQDHDRSID